MKQCSHCKEYKEEEEFAWANKILKVKQKQCRACIKEMSRISYERRSDEYKIKVKEDKKARLDAAREFVWDYLSTHPCVECGETDPRVLEFDHIAGDKKMAVSDMVRLGYGFETITAEISKCQVLCANCHRRKTHSERGWYSR
ncbi:conserved protein of unknown function [Candidatus Promineifilum breve]|uniref:Uncharacterized protein n=1 Tax=Candidatus Promineifilum breve TaxID=1806508 RepID=A0A160T6U6_9CHLR|nr:HNH endonuclease [Candidatus Promineifilum breve]CUS05299.2 conserved protein of unknown function [Candidatus Promineifilum breve]